MNFELPCCKNGILLAAYTCTEVEDSTSVSTFSWLKYYYWCTVSLVAMVLKTSTYRYTVYVVDQHSDCLLLIKLHQLFNLVTYCTEQFVFVDQLENIFML